MRHRRKGRTLGRSPSHRRALYRNLVSALVLTERPDSDLDDNTPKVKGRIVTTLAKAKEVRPLVEKCITIAKKGLTAQQAAEQYNTTEERNSDGWKKWRESDTYGQWVEANAPAVNARRRLFQILRNKEAVAILVDELAERFEDRPGGYTRVLKLATPRLGDNGTRAILEFVGQNDRVVERSEKPEFGGDEVADEAEETAESDVDSAKAEDSASEGAEQPADSEEEKKEE